MKRLSKAAATSKIASICDKHRIRLVLDDPRIERDNGLAVNDNEIHMSRHYTSV